MGNFAVIESVTVNATSTAGIFLDAVQGSVVKRVTVEGSRGPASTALTSGGIQLWDTSHCVVENSVANHNGEPYICAVGKPCFGANTSGIFVGNSGSQNLSMNNVIVNNKASYNNIIGISVTGTGNLVTGNTANYNNDGNLPIGVGISVDGSGYNVMIDNTALKNQTIDLSESNAQCGTDHWAVNTFTTSNQTCIH
jgi:parallel beta-helix repeat protein